MKEVSLDSKSSTGKIPFEHWTLTFTVVKSGKQYIFFGVNHKDYLAFNANYYSSEDTKGWGGYNYLKNKYTPEEVVEKTEEEDKKIDELFGEIRNRFNK